MHKYILVPAAVLILLLSMPTPVQAEDSCTGIACLFSWNFGFTERTQINADAKTEQTRIEQGELTKQLENNLKYSNDLNVRLQEVNRLADQRIAEAQSNQAIAQAQKDQYVAMVENWRQVQVETIRASNDQALAALHGQTDLGLKALEEKGDTVRYSIAWNGAWYLAILLIILAVTWRLTPSRTVIVQHGPRQLPGQRYQPSHQIETEFAYCEGYLDEKSPDDDDEVVGDWIYVPHKQLMQKGRISGEITRYRQQ